ncbi:MAG: hypothetical protein ACRD3Q_20350 [Terriglobales bacterium]
MPNVYVEPRPKGRPEGTPIVDYVLEFAGGQTLGGVFQTQAEAAEYATRLGHSPLCARVRNTNKGNPDHWRAC